MAKRLGLKPKSDLRVKIERGVQMAKDNNHPHAIIHLEEDELLYVIPYLLAYKGWLLSYSSKDEPKVSVHVFYLLTTAEINEHRVAVGRTPFKRLTFVERVEHSKKIENNAPYGNDPWA